MTTMRTAHGFTLVELVIVVAVVGVLAGVAAPSFNEIILAQRLKSTSFDLIASLSYARSEAIKRNATITIAPEGGNWASGWTVKHGTDLLRSQPSVANVTITLTGTTNIEYGRSGRVTTGANSTIEIDDNQSLSGIQPRCIRVNPAGVPRATQGAC